MLTRLAALCLSACLIAGPVAAQDDQTLADIRQEVSALAFELQKLKRELSTTGGAQVNVAGSTLDRVNQIESALQRLTSRTEELQNRIDRVVSDGSNRIGDLKFRLCELEEGCDIGSLDTEDPLGGAAPETGGGPSLGGLDTQSGPVTPSDIETGPVAGSEGASEGEAPLPLSDPNLQLAAAEEQDYRRARSALEAGEFQSAADQFASFRTTYPGGPLDAAALLGRGRALQGLGDTREAARAYLDVYSGYPDSPVAPDALWRLGAALGELGSVREACVTLAEVPNRYPGTDAVARAQEARSGLSCQ
ncbi:tol-pal system protein YbgF [Roseivivax jejudonensis]|uniref:Cell division coordinator CpoB n=1 Tax=Roseivivax jejudonensis TaxID=1529041 RepID=A0A1X7A132_9RHOB|nr:tol-pal system protein YbgF [Roseivivax jejudonensis]SLN67603.1 tol-pal system protein YbgF [Roseivivax jejudonensis]